MIVSGINLRTNSESVHIYTTEFSYFYNVSGCVEVEGGSKDKKLLIELKRNVKNNSHVEVVRLKGGVSLEKSCQTLILSVNDVSHCFMNDKKLSASINQYLCCIENLLTTATTSMHPINEIEAILSIIGSIFEVKPFDGNFAIISRCICNNYKNTNFNLDKLSKEVFMSKRKIQYCLRERNTAFKELLTEARLNGLASIIEVCPDAPLKSIVKRVGFPSLSSANYYFSLNFDVKLHDYQSLMKLKNRTNYRGNNQLSTEQLGLRG